MESQIQKVDEAFDKPHVCDECGVYRRVKPYWDSVASFSWICEDDWDVVVEKYGPSAN